MVIDDFDGDLGGGWRRRFVDEIIRNSTKSVSA